VKSDAKQEVEDPVKKELEAKNKEIIDLKVCFPGLVSLLFHLRGVFHNPAGSVQCSTPSSCSVRKKIAG
jgi:hypothetical protein